MSESATRDAHGVETVTYETGAGAVVFSATKDAYPTLPEVSGSSRIYSLIERASTDPTGAACQFLIDSLSGWSLTRQGERIPLEYGELLKLSPPVLMWAVVSISETWGSRIMALFVRSLLRALAESGQDGRADHWRSYATAGEIIASSVRVDDRAWYDKLLAL